MSENEAITCADCGSAPMFRHWRGIVLTSNPPQYPWDWQCHHCGRVEPGGSVVITTGAGAGAEVGE